MRPRNWFVLAAIVGAIGLVFVGCYAYSGSPRDYVSAHYTRAAQYDSGTTRAYTSAMAPTAVASDISDHWEPVDRLVNSTGVFLRYANDLIVIKPRGSGSLITVDDFRHGYHHYYGIVGGFWALHGGLGERFRGGGPGAGK